MKPPRVILADDPRTIAVHKCHAMEEWELKTNAGLVQFAIKNHIVA